MPGDQATLSAPIVRHNYQHSGIYPFGEMNTIGAMLSNVSAANGIRAIITPGGMKFTGQGTGGTGNEHFKVLKVNDTQVKVLGGTQDRDAGAVQHSLPLTTDGGDSRSYDDGITITLDGAPDPGDHYIVLRLTDVGGSGLNHALNPDTLAAIDYRSISSTDQYPFDHAADNIGRYRLLAKVTVDADNKISGIEPYGEDVRNQFIIPDSHSPNQGVDPYISTLEFSPSATAHQYELGMMNSSSVVLGTGVPDNTYGVPYLMKDVGVGGGTLKWFSLDADAGGGPGSDGGARRSVELVGAPQLLVQIYDFNSGTSHQPPENNNWRVMMRNNDGGLVKVDYANRAHFATFIEDILIIDPANITNLCDYINTNCDWDIDQTLPNFCSYWHANCIPVDHSTELSNYNNDDHGEYVQRAGNATRNAMSGSIGDVGGAKSVDPPARILYKAGGVTVAINWGSALLVGAWRSTDATTVTFNVHPTGCHAFDGGVSILDNFQVLSAVDITNGTVPSGCAYFNGGVSVGLRMIIDGIGGGEVSTGALQVPNGGAEFGDDVYVNDGLFIAILADSTTSGAAGYFFDGAGTATLADGNAAGTFTDGTGTVLLADNTYAVNVTVGGGTNGSINALVGYYIGGTQGITVANWITGGIVTGITVSEIGIRVLPAGGGAPMDINVLQRT